MCCDQWLSANANTKGQNNEKNNANAGHDAIEILTQRMTQADISEAQDMAKRCLASNCKDC
jgi:hypothetical protein